MGDINAILARAISDIGYWRWWAASLPNVFQVEFGGVQLWTAPGEAGRPPSGIVALRFVQPTVVAFLTDNDAQGLPDDWHVALHEDRIDSFSVVHDRFALCDEPELADIVRDCTKTFLVGDDALLDAPSTGVTLAFRADDVGLAIRAERLVVLSPRGELAAADIEGASAAWWAYWREYWRVRDTDKAMPKDFACEVTIPAKGARDDA